MSEDEATDLSKVPERLPSPVELDKTIDIWSGPATLICDKIRVEGEARVFLRLSTPSHVEFRLTVEEAENPFELMDLDGAGVLHTSSFLGDVSCQLTGDFSSSSSATVFSGLVDVDPRELFASELFSKAIYLVVNGPKFRGSPIRDGRSHYLGRMHHRSDQVDITLDKIDGSSGTETLYSVSHLAQLEFPNPVGLEFIDQPATNLFRALSLMNGGWVGLIGPWLVCPSGEPIRIVPYATKVVPSASGTPWYHESDQKGFGLVFDSLQSAYDDAKQCEAIQTAFHWLIESEQCAGAVEGSLILQQCAFECLAWLVIVQKRKLCSTSGFKGLPAADKIRLLLSTFQIDFSIPQKSASIAAYAKAYILQDMVDVLVDVRNALVHAEPSKAQRLVRPDDERGDLWFQIGGLLQQAFLAVIGYEGKLVRRDVSAEYAIHALKRVPWAKGETE